MNSIIASRWFALPLAVLALVLGGIAAAAEAPQSDDSSVTNAKGKAPKPSGLDRSGKQRKGKASYYGRKFYGKKMANGEPMHPQSNAAASKTLPLGTKAKVTNLESGRSAEVEIKDRGPYVKGRIIDVTPKVAEQLDMKKDGTAPVVVKPTEVPKEGEAKPDASSSAGTP